MDAKQCRAELLFTVVHRLIMSYEKGHFSRSYIVDAIAMLFDIGIADNSQTPPIATGKAQETRIKLLSEDQVQTILEELFRTAQVQCVVVGQGPYTTHQKSANAVASMKASLTELINEVLLHDPL